MKGILIEYVPAVRRALGVLLSSIALTLGSLGIWTMANLLVSRRRG
jgi:hypothetical protein